MGRHRNRFGRRRADAVPIEVGITSTLDTGMNAIREYHKNQGKPKTIGQFRQMTYAIVDEWGANGNGLHRKALYKPHYKVFLRLNDRKTMQSTVDFKRANYPYTIFWDFNKFVAATKWCNEQYGRYGYVNFVNFWFFENKEDLLLFELRWK